MSGLTGLQWRCHDTCYVLTLLLVPWLWRPFEIYMDHKYFTFQICGHWVVCLSVECVTSFLGAFPWMWSVLCR